MENIKAYIESGILELYVLDTLSQGEKLQVEEMAAIHAEVRAEIEQIAQSMEFYAREYAVEPAAHLRGRILNGLLTNLGDDRMFTKQRRHNDDEVFEDDKDNVVAFPVKYNSFYKYAFAACLALLLVSLFALMNVYNQLQDSSTQLTALLLDKQRVASQVNLMDSELNLYRDPAYRILKLQGTPKTPRSAMTLAWSPARHKVVVDVKSINLPGHDKQHQYQLWALVAGKPVDMGVFDIPAADTAGVKEMKSTAAADAFAVTLEPAGGSISPTLDQMVVIGKF